MTSQDSKQLNSTRVRALQTFLRIFLRGERLARAEPRRPGAPVEALSDEELDQLNHAGNELDKLKGSEVVHLIIQCRSNILHVLNQ